MKSLVRQIEEAVIAILKDDLEEKAKVSGFRESVETGLVKQDSGDGRPEVLVAVTPGVSDSYGSDILTFEVALSIRCDFEDDPTIAVFDEVAAIVERRLMIFNSQSARADVAKRLTSENFDCAGLTLRGGQDTALISMDQSSTVTTVMNFAVRGVFNNN